MTLKKVAELARVSRTTVSLVVNNADGSRVSSETRQRVLKAIRELDYKPNLIAQRLSLRKNNAIGLLIPFSSPLFSNATNVEIIGGVQEVANERGVDLVLFSSRKNCMEPDNESVGTILRQNAVDGLIVSNTRFSTRRFIDTVTRQMKNRDVNAVLLEYWWGKEEINYVGADYRSGIYQSIDYLIDLGHKSIGMITPPMEALVTGEMIDSYKRALEDNGLPFSGRLVITADYTPQMTRDLTRRLITENDGLTSIFVGDYEMALSCVKTVKEMNLNVPRDISVVSFADHEVFPFLDPSLTAVSIPYHEMGRKAAELLFDESGKKQQFIFPTDLAVRDSTARAVR